MNIFNLVGKLTLDTSDYDKKIEESKQKGEGFASNTKNKVSPMAVAGWVAVATAVAGVIKKIGDLAMATANYADQIGDTAEKWGFTTKEIQEFDYWATQNGTTLESLLTGMRSLVNQAQAGNTAFEQLGVSVRDANGNLKDQKTLFLETTTALQRVENQTERNALQFDVFGRAGVELGQVINLTGDQLEALSQKAEDYGIIISDKAIKASSDFNDELDTLKKQFNNVIATLMTGEEQAPEVVDKFFDNLILNIEKYLPAFLKFLRRFFTELTRAMPSILEPLITGVIEWFIDYVTSLDWLTMSARMTWSIAKAIVKGIINSISSLFGFKVFDDNQFDVNANNTSDTINTLNSSIVNERTTKTEETLEVTMKVESDGTVAGEKNLDVMSDLIVAKINKSMGDMING